MEISPSDIVKGAKKVSRIVHSHRDLYLLAPRPPNSHLPTSLPNTHFRIHNQIHPPPPRKHPHNPPLHPLPPLPNRNSPNLHLPPIVFSFLLLLLPPSIPHPHPHPIHRRHHHRPTAMVHHPSLRMRDLRAGLDPADISSFNTKGSAREGAEAGMASGVEVGERGVVVWGLSSVCAWVCE